MSVVEYEVDRNGSVILRGTYEEPNVTIQSVIDRVHDRVILEGLNKAGDCMIRARFANLGKKGLPHG